MQFDPSAKIQGDEVAPADLPQLPEPIPVKKSIWGKAKDSLGDVSTQAAKVAALGSASAAKTADVGKKTLGADSEVARGAIGTGKAAYSGSKLESALNYVDNELDQRGAKTAIKKTAGAVVDKLDQVSGKRLVELLEEKLEAQDGYNDVLATRLAEALERISSLETTVAELQNKAANEH